MSSADARLLYSGLIRLHILHHAAEETLYGQGIAAELGRHGYRLSPGTLYPLLHGLERAGYLKGEYQLHEARRRRVYRVTREGRKALLDAKKRVRELFGELFEDR
jgi:DNA-binding PadR family transcriptional regulator